MCYSKLLPNSYFLSSLNCSSITLPSNSIVDIQEGINGKLYFGTSEGLGYAEIDNSNPIFYTVASDNLPRGGNPATFIYNNIIAISGVIDTAVVTGDESAGTGISYSDVNDNIWQNLKVMELKILKFLKDYNLFGNAQVCTLETLI